MTTLTGTSLYSFLYAEFGDNFNGTQLSNVLWQLIVNEAWKGRNIHCFVPAYDQYGLVLGIAEQHESGYHNTHVYFNETINFDRASDLIDQLNEQMFGLLPTATLNIVASSMRKYSEPRKTN